MFFSFSALLLAGHPKGEWGLLARPRGAFCGGAKKLRSIVLFLGGTANPEGGEAEAEARRAASAQAAFPARRAREKKALEKEDNGEIKPAKGIGERGHCQRGQELLCQRRFVRDV